MDLGCKDLKACKYQSITDPLGIILQYYGGFLVGYGLFLLKKGLSMPFFQNFPNRIFEKVPRTDP